MFLGIYKALMHASTPFLEVYLQRRQRAGKEDAARKAERRGIAKLPRTSGALIWCHAASVGESLSLLFVIKALRRRYPAASVMVTTGTVTSAQLMAQRLPEGAFHQYMPVDHPVWTERFLDHWQPDFVIWSESEFWPNMLSGIKRRNIPAVLLNARMSEKSFSKWKWAGQSMQRLLSAFSLCLAQDKQEAERLQQLGAADARVAVNLKYAALPPPVDEHVLADMQKTIGARPVVFWASTHAGEEVLARETHDYLVSVFPNLLTIIAPRHPKRAAEIAESLGPICHRRSLGVRPDPHVSLYLADTLGEMGLFFRLCRYVVMGGSFANIGGHNPIEPAQLGCTIFFGPSGHNFKAVLQDFMTEGALCHVATSDELQEKLMQAISGDSTFQGIGKQAEKLTSSRAKSAEDIMTHLFPLIDSAFHTHVHLRANVQVPA